jgi:ABC-type proline/glycine betaine transport system substrate-binding protein
MNIEFSLEMGNEIMVAFRTTARTPRRAARAWLARTPSASTPGSRA